MTFAGLGGWPAVLTRLTAREELPAEMAGFAMAEVLDGRATSAQVAAFCVGLRMKGETVGELAALLGEMLQRCTPVSMPDDSRTRLVDTCGTGGDRSGTINASTIAALVVAGAGAPVCKHGNRAASSQCGSADVLEALGVAIELGPDDVVACIEQAGMGFCFAPRYHPALRHVGPTRRELGVPTVFNVLGPLANPARVRRRVVGVSDPRLADRVAELAMAAGSERALVVFGHDGLDELTTTTTSTVVEVRDGETRRYEVEPTTLGLSRREASDLKGGDALANAEAVRRVLGGETGPQRDFVLLNAAAGVVAAGLADDLQGGLGVAGAAIDDGRASAVLDSLVRVSQERAAAATVAGDQG